MSSYNRYYSKPVLSQPALVLLSLVALILFSSPILIDNTIIIWAKIAIPLYIIASGIFLSTFCHNTTLVKNNVLLPVFTLILTAGALHYAIGWWKGLASYIPLFLIWYKVTLLKTRENNIWDIFFIMFLFGITTFISGVIWLLLPAIIIGLIIYNKFNIRSLLASVMGVGSVFAITASIAYLTDKWELYANQLKDSICTFSLPNIAPMEVAIYTIIAIYTFMACISFIHNYKDTNESFRHLLLFSYMFILNAIIVAIFTNSLGIVQPITAMLLGLVLSHYADTLSSKASHTVFHIAYTSILVLFSIENFVL